MTRIHKLIYEELGTYSIGINLTERELWVSLKINFYKIIKLKWIETSY